MKIFQGLRCQLENESAAAFTARRAGCNRRLEDGTLDMIVTDHAPHSAEEKASGMQLAPFGIVGFETAFPLLYTKFVRTGKWTLGFLLQRMTVDPARRVQAYSGRLEVGAPADITIVDLESGTRS